MRQFNGERIDEKREVRRSVPGGALGPPRGRAQPPTRARSAPHEAELRPEPSKGTGTPLSAFSSPRLTQVQPTGGDRSRDFARRPLDRPRRSGLIAVWTVLATF